MFSFVLCYAHSHVCYILQGYSVLISLFVCTVCRARALGFSWDKVTFAFAASGGHLEVLKWMRENGCEWNYATCLNAARAGHLHVLQWARANGCEWDPNVMCSDAAASGNLELLQYVHANGCNLNAVKSNTCQCAALGGHLDILKWARASGAAVFVAMLPLVDTWKC